MNKEKLTRKEKINYITEALTILLGVIAIAYASYLSIYFFLALIVLALAIIPFIIKAHIKQKNSYTKYEHLCNYLTNIIPIFTQKTKIRFALGELYGICDGEVKNSIEDAIEYIDNTKNDPNLLKNGLKKIEDKFNNSRLESIHKFLLSVENTNSSTYKDIADNLNKDVDEWIKRTNEFQKDLKNRQVKLLLLCFLTLILNTVFVFVYVSNEYFVGFVENKLYQVSTFIFISLILEIIAIITIKLNGDWLISDTKNRKEDKLQTKYRDYKKGKQKIKVFDIVLAVILLSVAIYFLIVNYYSLFIIFVVLSTFVLLQKTIKYSNLKRYITKELTIEFPMWLREVSLSLGNLTVLNAIENSLLSSSYAFRREIRNFLINANNNPTSIKPYNEFLNEYRIDGVKPSMRILYAVNNVSKTDMKDRVAKLIDRNQDMLTKSEKIRNYDSLGNIEAIGYLPAIIFSFHTMVSMIVMFTYMLQVLEAQL